MGFGTGARKSGGEFFKGSVGGRVFTEGAIADGGVVSTLDEDQIARSSTLRGQTRERIFTGAPKFWKITNRAEYGHVKVWMGTFDGEPYPEGATSDKETWLKPGESMIVPLEAGLHFVGNVFDPRAPEAREVIERCGGFEMETDASAPGKNAPVRIIGGPIGLPDFVVSPMNGRGQIVGEPVAVYELYDKATRAVRVRRRGNDPAVLAAEKELLEQRFAEFTLDDAPIYGANGDILSTAQSRNENAGEIDMRTVDQGDTDDEPTPRKRARA